jgi:hypothetical protein
VKAGPFAFLLRQSQAYYKVKDNDTDKADKNTASFCFDDSIHFLTSGR